MRPRRVVVVGGGIAGLATAYRLREGARRHDVGLAVTLLEASDRLGGNIRTERARGYTVEWGPNGFLDNVPATLELARDLGLEEELQPADPRAARRFLWRHGRLHALPTGPGSFLRSGVLSVGGRLRVFLEPFQPRGPVDADESVRDFGVRRIGAEAADVLIDAMVSGVFAGDASALSLPSAFPKMRAMEAEYGSLVRAMLARRRAGQGGGGPAGPGGTLTSFREGLDTLTEALIEALADSTRTGAPVSRLERAGDGWRVHPEGGETLEADEVVLAVPAHAAARILEDPAPAASSTLDEAPVAGLAVVALGFPEKALARAPDGFGFLVPRSEGLRILGCLRDSSIFPGRAPEGKVLLRAMIGGAHDPAAVRMPDDALTELVLGELRITLGVQGDPELVRVIRHPLGIAQYNVGHGARLARLDALLADAPGLTLTGSAYHGVAMNACIARADEDARSILDRLTARGPDPASQRS